MHDRAAAHDLASLTASATRLGGEWRHCELDALLETLGPDDVAFMVRFSGEDTRPQFVVFSGIEAAEPWSNSQRNPGYSGLRISRVERSQPDQLAGSALPADGEGLTATLPALDSDFQI